MLIALFWAAASCSFASVPVVDASREPGWMELEGSSSSTASSSWSQAGEALIQMDPDGSESTAVPVASAKGAAAQEPSADFSTRLQNLQEDLRALRGQCEEQAEALRVLADRQKTFYSDLDKRLAALEKRRSKP